MQHLILTGTDQQIDSSKTLKAICDDAIDNGHTLGLVNIRDNTPIENIFNPLKFTACTKTVIVYTNNRPFDFIEFFIYHATNVSLYQTKIQFVFLCRRNPFEQTNEITKRFNVINVAKQDGELNVYEFENLSIIRLDNKINALLQMVETVQESQNFSDGEKKLLCGHFQKLILETHTKRLKYADHSSQEIINQIDVKA